MTEISTSYGIVWLVRRLFRAMTQKSNEYLQDLGVSAADRAVLEFLYPAEKLSVPEIAERYQVSRQHVQVTVNSLLESALLESVINPRHKRSRLISLTSEGKALFEKIKQRDTDAIDRLFSTIPANDRKVTQKTLQSLLEKLK
jgi:DNA-binding MarR family transcriptional regulator